MKRSELSKYSGYDVQLTVNGEDVVATLSSDDPDHATLRFIDVPGVLEWLNDDRYLLSDDDISSFRENGQDNLFSMIALKREKS